MTNVFAQIVVIHFALSHIPAPGEYPTQPTYLPYKQLTNHPRSVYPYLRLTTPPVSVTSALSYKGDRAYADEFQVAVEDLDADNVRTTAQAAVGEVALSTRKCCYLYAQPRDVASRPTLPSQNSNLTKFLKQESKRHRIEEVGNSLSHFSLHTCVKEKHTSSFTSQCCLRVS